MKWEYAVLYHQSGRDPQYQGWSLNGHIQGHLKGFSQSEVLNGLGKEGWELVSVLLQERDPDPWFYLKRAE